jgi:hypothetical protein
MLNNFTNLLIWNFIDIATKTFGYKIQLFPRIYEQAILGGGILI